MKKALVISGLVLVAFLVVGPVHAAKDPLDTAAFLAALSLKTDGAAICQAPPLAKPELKVLLDIDGPAPESCFPPECSFSGPCCKNKCYILLTSHSEAGGAVFEPFRRA